MFGQASHIAYTIIFSLLPLGLTWILWGGKLSHDIGLIAKFTAVVVILLPIGDGWAISHHVWGFSPDRITGIWIAGAPLDDYILAAILTPLCASLALSGYYIQAGEKGSRRRYIQTTVRKESSGG
jgi:lycopene cyclase domain-containing protein